MIMSVSSWFEWRKSVKSHRPLSLGQSVRPPLRLRSAEQAARPAEQAARPAEQAARLAAGKFLARRVDPAPARSKHG